MRNGITRLSVLCALVAMAAACTVHQSETPSLTGPSEFATSIRVTATPDTINQDGASQSAILVTAFDASGKPAQGIVLRMDMMVAGAIQDFGTLSARSLVTGADGKASAMYTAPPAPPAGSGGSGTHVSILAIPNGSDAQVSQKNGALADIRLVPPGVILPPAGTPTAEFSVSPTPVNLNVEATFDASASTPGTGATRITSYSWSFGDGDTSNRGPSTTHTFETTGTFSVTLTVTNDRGLSASTTQTVSVGAVTAPTASFVVSPESPIVNSDVVFDASPSSAAPGHTITEYRWIFGDGATATGPNVTHRYTTANTYNVTLTITDDSGQKTTASKSVPVGTGSPVASFTFVVTNPGTHTIQVNGNGSAPAPGASIVSYSWNWGDGSPTDNGAIVSHSFSQSSATTWSVKLTVTDNLGRTGVVTQPVTVP